MTQADDPWAWAHERPAEAVPDLNTASVLAVLVAPRTRVAGVLDCLGRLERRPDRIVVVGEQTADGTTGGEAPWPGAQFRGTSGVGFSAAVKEGLTGATEEFVWLLHDDATFDQDTLSILLARLLVEPDLAATGPLLVQPRRRGFGRLIAELDVSVGPAGAAVEFAEPGEHDQGQHDPVDVLGLPTCGLLVRRAVLVDLGGLDERIADSRVGVEFGWRVNLAGHRVALTPGAAMHHRGEAADPVADRASGLLLAAAHARTAYPFWLPICSALAALGYLLGKDPRRAADEIRALRSWLRDPHNQTLRERVAELRPDASTRARVAKLRPGARGWVRRRAQALAGWVEDLGEWSGEEEPPVSTEELAGDGFFSTAAGRPRRRLPALAWVLGATLLALIAAVSLLGEGHLVGPRLLPAPESAAGFAGWSSVGWEQVLAVASVIGWGRPVWPITLLVLGFVPVSWACWVVGLGRLVPGGAGLATHAAAAMAALAPVVLGAVSRGELAALVLGIVGPLLLWSACRWPDLAEEAGQRWRWPFVVAVLTTVGGSFWPPLLGAAVVVLAVGALRKVVPAGPAAVAALTPPLLVSPWLGTLVAWPGRLLTGPDPVPAGALPSASEVLLGRDHNGVPEWAAWTFAIALLALAVAGATRRARSLWWVASAALCLGVAGVLGRTLVQVAPGVDVRPDAGPWLVAASGALVCAAVVGLFGVDERRRLAAATAVVTSVALIAGAVGWLVGGSAGLRRDPLKTLPAFVAQAQVGQPPTRTLAITFADGRAGWALLQDDQPRLGDQESGGLFAGSPDALALGGSVAGRLVGGSADASLLPDLRQLGVGHLWVRGSTPAQRVAIANAPGLGVGTGDARGWVWPVRDSARAMLLGGGLAKPLPSGADVPSGPAGRTLTLAEAGAPWQVRVSGRQVDRASSAGFGQRFEIPAEGGRVDYGRAPAGGWWVWAQLGLLVVAMVMAAPPLRRRGSDAPRRVLREVRG